jgi:urease accessory protein
MRLPSRLILILLLVSCSSAQAHTGAHAQDSLIAGLMHPFSGLDHLLAMVAVGMWATQLGGRYLLTAPAVFVFSMALGAIAGASGAQLPMVETGTGLSVLVLGVLITLAARAPGHWVGLLIALFAVFHGFAHGTEMPASADRWSSFAGFLSATALLHGLGVATGSILKSRGAMLRAGGALIGLAGVWLLAAA